MSTPLRNLNVSKGLKQRAVVYLVANPDSNESGALVPVFTPTDRNACGLACIHSRFGNCGIAAVDPKPRRPFLSVDFPRWMCCEDPLLQIGAELRGCFPCGLQIRSVIDGSREESKCRSVDGPRHLDSPHLNRRFFSRSEQ